jgi:hypothetical protein
MEGLRNIQSVHVELFLLYSNRGKLIISFKIEIKFTEISRVILENLVNSFSNLSVEHKTK